MNPGVSTELAFRGGYCRLFCRVINSAKITELPCALWQQIKQHLLAIWGGLPAHRAALVRECLEALNGAIWIEQPPPYAPELNPTEYVWDHLKHHKFASRCDVGLARSQARHAPWIALPAASADPDPRLLAAGRVAILRCEPFMQVSIVLCAALDTALREFRIEVIRDLYSKKSRTPLQLVVELNNMPRQAPHRFGAVIFSTVSVFLLPLLSGANQSAIAQEDSLQEIVVTARKTAERLQDIPLAITAFSSKDIQNAGAVDLGDIANLTPGLSFNVRGSSYKAGRVDSVIRMRGVTGTSDLDHLQPTSVFVDGIYVLGTASTLGLQDLERVEVIKGPQSAFFGRNTFAGAINYVTKNPSLVDFVTQLDISSAQYHKNDFNLLHSGPILSGKLAYQFNVREYKRGAEWMSTDGSGLGEESSQVFSGVLYGKPTDKLEFKLRLLSQKDEDGPPAVGAIRGGFDYDSCTGKTYERLGVDGSPITIRPTRYFCGDIPTIHSPSMVLGISTGTSLSPPELSQNHNGLNSETGQVLVGPQPNAVREYLLNRQYVKDAPTIDHFGLLRLQKRAALNVDYAFANGYALSFLGGSNESRQTTLRDYDQTDIFAWISLDSKYARDWSAELRLTSPRDQRLKWLLGLTTYKQEFLASANGGLLISPCLPSNCNAGPGIYPTPTTAGNDADVQGIFGSVSFNITDTLSVDLETRYMKDKRTVAQTGFSYAHTFKQWTPRAILQYKPTENTNIYGQYSVGVLPGVTNGNVVTCSADAFLVPYISPYTGQPTTASECDQIRSVLGGGTLPASTGSQELKSIELGYKQVLPSLHARFAVSAWRYKWKGLPTGVGVSIVRDAADPALRDRIPNAFPNLIGVTIEGSENLWGMELEAAYSPIEKLELTYNMSWSGNEYTKFFSTLPAPAGGFSNLKGLEAPRYPEWTWNLGATYRDRMNKNWEWYARSDITYNGSYWADFANLARAPDWLIVNARLGMQRDDLRIELFARNLFNNDKPESAHITDNYAIPGNFAFSSNQNLILKPLEKRTVGLRVNLRF